MNPERPILIVGFGSAGRRHLRNLKALGQKNFVLYRSGKSILADDEIVDIPAEYDLSKALECKPLATIIANPTSLHINLALAAAKAGSHIFLEKPISNNLENIDKLQSLIARKGLMVQVGFQFRFHPLLRQIKHLLEEGVVGRVTSVQAHWGEYLPNWHPGEDYHQSYSAREELGGGVILTLSHPFDYLRYLLGEVKSVFAVTQTGKLGTDVEESADILLNFKSEAVGNVHLDYIQQPPEHFLRIIGEKGVVYWDGSEGLKWSGVNGKWKKQMFPKNFERNQMFISEMTHFLSCIAKKEQPLCSLEDGVKSLKIALAAKESAKKGAVILIK